MPRDLALTTLEKYFLSFLVIFPLAYLPLSPDDTVNFLHAKFLFWLVWLLLLGGQVSREERLRFRKSDWLLAAMLLWMVLSQLVNGQSPFFIGARLEGLLTTLGLFATYLLTRETAGAVRWGKLLRLWPLYLAVPVLFGIWQYLFPGGHFNLTSSEVRVVHSTFGNRATLAALLMLFIPAALLLPVRQPRWTAILCAVLLGFAFAIAQTRATWGAVAGTAVLLLVWAALFRRANLRPLLLSLGLGATGFGLALSIPDAHRDDHFSVSSGRGVFWPIAVKAIQEKPVFGWGTGGYKQAFDRYADWRNDPATRDLILLSFGSQAPEATSTIEQDADGIYVVDRVDLGKVSYGNRTMVTSDKAHNEYLDNTVQYGIPFLVIWLTWLASVLLSVRPRRGPMTQIAVAASLVALLAYNIFWMNSIAFLPLVYIFLGLIQAAGSAKREDAPGGLVEDQGSVQAL